MDWLKSRFVIVSIVVLGGIALAVAQGQAEFAYLDLHAADGRALSLRAAPLGAHTLRFAGEGAEALVELPATTKAGETASVFAQVQHDGRLDHGMLTFEVQETGRFLSGTLHGTIGGWGLNGGLRVRHLAPQQPAPQEVAARQ